MIPLIGILDITAEQALVIATITMVAAILPMVGTLFVLAIQQYARVRQAWVVANSNSDTLKNTVVPALTQLQQDTTAAHEQILGVINGGQGQSGGAEGANASGTGHP